MQPQRPVVQVSELEVSLGGNPVLKRLSLSVHKGEIFALLGPNGAGKSTLTQSIIGQIRPGKGQIRVSGRDPRRSKRARQAVGLVPQQIALYEKLTPQENLVAFGAIMGMSRRSLRVRSKELLDRVGLSDRASDQVRHLSGGMR